MRAHWKRLDNGIYLAHLCWGTKNVYALGDTLRRLLTNIRQNAKRAGIYETVYLDTNPVTSIEVTASKAKRLFRLTSAVKTTGSVQLPSADCAKQTKADDKKPAADSLHAKFVSKIDGDDVVVYEIKEVAKYPLVSKGAF